MGTCVLFRQLVVVCLLAVSGCAYRYFADPLQPAAEMAAAGEMQVSDDGTITYIRDRLEISLRPVTDEELNRQFVTHSQKGIFSANPYTFGSWVDPELGDSPPRFTVFRVKIKNYMYPKLRVDPLTTRLVAQNGREYTALSLAELEWYYQKYVTGYAGNSYSLFKERLSLLRSTLYPGDMVFSGQEAEGFVVFPALHHDVRRIRVQLRNVALRFDVWDEPVERVDIEYVFERRIGRVHPDGVRSEGV
jgi:hypothetical protein